jgi:hypothetical protein
MQKLFIFFAMALLALSLACCKNRFVSDDDVIPAPALPDKEVVLAKGEVTLLDLTKNFKVKSSTVFSVKNEGSLKGQIKITNDGYLVYQAPSTAGKEDIVLEVKDVDNNTVQDALIKVQILNQPVGTGNCYFNLQGLSVPAGGVTADIKDFLAKDNACGNKPTGDFELIFEPKELPYQRNGTKFTILPKKDGNQFDYLVYKGRYANQDSAYLTGVLISNSLACIPWPIDDEYNIKFSPDSATYDLNILANDQFCTFSPIDSFTVEGVIPGEVKHGTIEVINKRYLKYRPNPGVTLPIEEFIRPVITVRSPSLRSTTYTHVYLKIVK